MNIVKEHIDFQRGLDPKEAMDIGDKNNIDLQLNSLVKEFNGTIEIEVDRGKGYTIGLYNHTEVRDGAEYGYSYFIKHYSISDSYAVGYIKPSASRNPEWPKYSARDCKKQIRKWILDYET